MTLKQALDIERGDAVRIKVGAKLAIVTDIEISELQNGTFADIRCFDGEGNRWYGYRELSFVNQDTKDEYMTKEEIKEMVEALSEKYDAAFHEFADASADEPNATTNAAMEEAEKILHDPKAETYSKLDNLFEDLGI